ncbi:MAG: hypothetical protein IPK31_16925 [Chitinophagaceae bacterium]|nr:hypothetical protein [Chitinophagaceae bacterium]
MIKVNVIHERWKYQPTPEEQKTLDEFVNGLLEPVMIDCILFKASVDAVKTIDGNYRLEPKCDQYLTLMAMQNLLPKLIPDFK